MIKKLRIKFICINMAFAILMLGVIFVTVLYSTKYNLEQDSVSLLRRIAEQPFFVGNTKQNAAFKVLPPFFSVEMNRFGEIVSVNGEYFDLQDHSYLERLAESSFGTPGDIGVLEDCQLRYYHISAIPLDRVVFVDMTSENSTIANLIEKFLLVGGFSLVAFFFMSLWLSRWAVRPVELAWRQQKRFVADASHELRTPLTVILTNADMMTENQYHPENLPRLTDNILEESRQMRDLVENLLGLAKADDGLPKADRKKTDLSAIAMQQSLFFEPLLYEKGHRFSYEIEPGVFVSGNEPQLRQIFEILLDNAGKYALSGGNIILRLKSFDAKRCLLSVANDGEEIPKQQLRQIFERFYRGDKARSAGGGYGLGLAIASSCVKNHRGKIWVESIGGVNTFYVKLRKL